jgi:hypothetical protein
MTIRRGSLTCALAALWMVSGCADGTLPAPAASNPANPNARETPATAGSASASAPPAAPAPDDMSNMPGMSGMDHSQMNHAMPGSTASGGLPTTAPAR